MTKGSRSPALCWGWLCSALLLTQPLAAQPGQATLSCEIKENGEAATGTVSVRRGETEVATGSCGRPLKLSAGAYTAVLSLDGALDGPKQERTVELKAGGSAKLEADFATGIVEVRIEQAGRRAAGMAVIRRDGVQIGTLGSGVSAHLSAGTYEIVARYRTQEKRFEAVAVARGQRIVLDAAFD